MDIRTLHGSQSLNGPHFRNNTVARPSVSEPSQGRTVQQRDTVQFSAAAQRLTDAGTSTETTMGRSGIRFDLVNRVRAEIAAGNYDTPDKMDAAVAKMLNSL